MTGQREWFAALVAAGVSNSLGRRAIEAARAEDYPVLTAAVLVTAVCVLVANLLGELAASRLDPRVRLIAPQRGKAVHAH